MWPLLPWHGGSLLDGALLPLWSSVTFPILGPGRCLLTAGPTASATQPTPPPLVMSWFPLWAQGFGHVQGLLGDTQSGAPANPGPS